MLTNNICKSVDTTTKKYNICHSEKLGRYLVAAKKISEGEIIIREDPVVVGPSAFNKVYLCFACLRQLNKKPYYICSKCNVASLCNPICENSKTHHTTHECNILRNNKELYSKNTQQIIGILLYIRLWLIEKKNPELWKQIEQMESHMDERRNTELWKDREENVVNVFRKMNLILESDENAGELLQQISGILDVNSFELRPPGGLGDFFLRGLYINTSLIAHDCRGNTHVTVDDKFQLTVFASLPIQEGDIIYFNYTASLSGSAERREHLREGKYFECECPTCQDPYEGGSYLSSILCPRCRKGYVAIKNPLVIDHYGNRTEWQCQACERLFYGCLLRSTLQISRQLMNEVEETDIKGLESLLKKLSRTFHTNHFLILSLKQKLLSEYRRELSSPNPQKKTLIKMLHLCKEIFNVLEIVEPGISRLKGIMLYEMHFPVAILANRAYVAQEISAEDVLLELEKAQNLLKRAFKMLLLEPATTPEGMLAKRALQELKILNQNIDDVRSQETIIRNHKKKNNFCKKRTMK